MADEAKKQLYLGDCYMKEFEAEVTSAGRKDEKSQFVVLNRTAFYPSSGGQPHDTGTMTRVKDGSVFRVVFVGKFSGKISHEAEAPEGPELKRGDSVKCAVDWDRRYALMRYHTAAHVLSEVIHKETGARITGNQLDVDRGRIDLDLENFDRDAMQSYADKANGIIGKGLPVRKFFMPREEALKNPDMLSLKNIMPPNLQTWRVVQIGDSPYFDIKACGGCHVDSTSEIGNVEIVKIQNKGKSNRRIYYRLV